MSSYVNTIGQSPFHDLNYFAASSRQNLSNTSLSSCSSFIRFAFASASLSTPVANCDRACSCERGTFRFSCNLVLIFLFKRVLSSGAFCSTSSSLNSFVSDSFALSLSCCCSSSSGFPSPFCYSMNDVSAGSEHRESNRLFVPLKIGLTILNYSTPWTQDVNWTYIRRWEDVQGVFWASYVRSIYVLCRGGGSSAQDNPGPVFFLSVIFRHCCFNLLYLICKGFTPTTNLVSFFFTLKFSEFFPWTEHFLSVL